MNWGRLLPQVLFLVCWMYLLWRYRFPWGETGIGILLEVLVSIGLSWIWFHIGVKIADHLDNMK